MEKINLNIQFTKYTKVEFQEQLITISQYIESSDRASLISSYLDHLFDANDDNVASRYVVAELSLILQIVDVCTNISIDNLNINDLINSGLWHIIKNKIKNYDEFRNDLEQVLKIYQFERRIDKTFGTMFENLWAKILVILEKLNDTDIKDLQTAVNDFSKEIKNLNNEVPGILAHPKNKRRKDKKAE